VAEVFAGSLLESLSGLLHVKHPCRLQVLQFFQGVQLLIGVFDLLCEVQYFLPEEFHVLKYCNEHIVGRFYPSGEPTKRTAPIAADSSSASSLICFSGVPSSDLTDTRCAAMSSAA
jgi:hypothetical protein